ncbi:MAG TPA: thioredoxin-dependent thiol peroxidase [Edaphocola sp.]|nr:thioredoxin-dependent thiol peroxidase [Edaphocola sp.]
MMTLRPGDKAPGFALKDQSGRLVTLNDFKGKKLALYFYPKDNTPGCTAEACSLSENFASLQKDNIFVLGVSADPEASHKKFAEKYRLPFPLLVDEDKKVINDYGVWGEKKFMGRKFMGILRTTFLINEEGMIAHIIDKVKTKAHAAQILEIWLRK